MRKQSIYKWGVIIFCVIVYMVCEWAMRRADDWFPSKSAAITEDTLLVSVVDTAQYTGDIGGYTDSVRITIVDSNNNISKQVMIYYK